MQSNIPLLQSLAMMSLQIRKLGGGEGLDSGSLEAEGSLQSETQIQTAAYVTQHNVMGAAYLLLFVLFCRLSAHPDKYSHHICPHSKPNKVTKLNVDALGQTNVGPVNSSLLYLPERDPPNS